MESLRKTDGNNARKRILGGWLSAFYNYTAVRRSRITLLYSYFKA